jgi:hypothetical protein
VLRRNIMAVSYELTKKEVRQLEKIANRIFSLSCNYKSTITAYFRVLVRAARKNLREDNDPTIHSFFNECYEEAIAKELQYNLNTIIGDNKALLTSKNDLNTFTTYLKIRCKIYGKQLVQLRDKTFIEIEYRPENKEDDTDAGFFTETHDNCRMWRLDGSSVTSDDYDIISIRE